jgi:hypothetical protein
MAPIFSAVLGRLVLHASAVQFAEQVVGFVGRTGAGKSTLSEFLAGRGRPFASDDLLPIRFDPGPQAPVEGVLLPLGALFLLRRTDTTSVTVVGLSEKDALRALVQNGFGEHGDGDVWAMQFDGYHRLATRIPLFDLNTPDDLGALEDVEASLNALAARGFRPAHPNGSG